MFTIIFQLLLVYAYSAFGYEVWTYMPDDHKVAAFGGAMVLGVSALESLVLAIKEIVKRHV